MLRKQFEQGVTESLKKDGISSTAIACVKRELRSAITEIRSAGWADGIDLDVVEGPAAYLFGEETDGSSYVLFPYTEKHSPYCGITGTRLFPSDHSLEADDVGTVDVMAVVV